MNVRYEGGLLSLIGFGFWQAWWVVAMCTDVLLPDPAVSPFPLSLTIVLLILNCLGYACLLVVGRFRSMPMEGSRGWFVGIGVLSAVGSLGMGLVAHTEALLAFGGALFVIAALLFSFGNAMLLLTWGNLWSKLAVAFVGRLLSASYTAALVLFFVIETLPLGVALIATALLPVLSLVGFSYARKTPQRNPLNSTFITDRKAFPLVRSVVALFVANVIWGISQNYLYVQGEGFINSAFGIAGAFLAVLTIYMVARPPANEPAALYKPIIPAMTCGIIGISLFSGIPGYFGEGLVVFGGYCLDMLIMLVACDLAFRMRGSVVVYFGGALLSARIGSLAGTALGEVLARMPVSQTTVAFLCIALLVVTGTILFTQTDLDRFYRVQLGRVISENLDDKVDTIADLCGLTVREREILALLARGRSAPFISDELHIALGTTKNHISSIYRKVGVGDRQSLHSVIEQCAPELPAAP